MTTVQPALDGSTPPPDDFEAWIDLVWPAYVRAADSGLPFTTSEVAKRENLPDPPDPAHQWGSLPGRLIKAGLIQPYATGNSKRPTVHGSLVHTWIGIPARYRRRAA